MAHGERSPTGVHTRPVCHYGQVLTLVLLGLAVIFVALGVVFSRSGSHKRHWDAGFRGRAMRATAQVTAVNEVNTNSPGYVTDVVPGGDDALGTGMPTYFFPVVSFTTADGSRVEHQVLAGARPAPAKTGQSVEVLYDPADPAKVMLAHGLATARTNGVILGCLGAGLIGFAVLLILVWVLLVVVLNVPT